MQNQEAINNAKKTQTVFCLLRPTFLFVNGTNLFGLSSFPKYLPCKPNLRYVSFNNFFYCIIHQNSLTGKLTFSYILSISKTHIASLQHYFQKSPRCKKKVISKLPPVLSSEKAYKVVAIGISIITGKSDCGTGSRKLLPEKEIQSKQEPFILVTWFAIFSLTLCTEDLNSYI